MAAWGGCAQARDLPLYYYNLALQARANYERALATNRPEVIRAYYNYALAAHDDYVRAYQAYYGQPVVQPVAARPVVQRVAATPGPDATKGKLARTKTKTEDRKQAATAPADKTTLSLSGGFRYATDTSGRPDIIPREDSFILNTTASLLDERKLGSIRSFRLRTDFSVYADFYLDNSESDYDVLSLKLGPVFPLSKEWQLAVLPFGEVSFLDYKRFSHKGGFAAAIENLGDHYLHTLEVKFGRENFSSDFDGRDAGQPEINATLAFYDTFDKADKFFVTPSFAFNNAEDSRFRYLQPGVSLQYETPFGKSVLFALTLNYFARLYEGKDINVARNRRDANFLASPTLTYKGFIFDSVDLIGHYSYRQNWSNDGAEDYESHSVGLNVKWDY